MLRTRSRDNDEAVLVRVVAILEEEPEGLSQLYKDLW